MEARQPDSATASVPSVARVMAVVVTYNGQEWIQNCVRHLLASSHSLAEILIVDNASADGTVTCCDQLPKVTVIRNASNLGFGRANNIGISEALRRGASHVLLVNQDACVEPNMVQQLLSAMTPRVGIATPLQWNDSGELLDAIFLQYYLADSARTFLSDAVKGCVQPAYSVSSTPAAMWLCSREMLECVGGFDPLFFMYCEDDDVCRRARRQAFEVVVVPTAHFRHLRGFYAGASLAPWRMRLRRKTVRARSTFLYTALDVNGRLPVQLWRASVVVLLAGLQQMLNHADWVSALSSLSAVTLGLRQFRQIRQHRQLASTVGPHWLSIERR